MIEGKKNSNANKRRGSGQFWILEVGNWEIFFQTLIHRFSSYF
jgi:hypothetical protein